MFLEEWKKLFCPISTGRDGVCSLKLLKDRVEIMVNIGHKIYNLIHKSFLLQTNFKNTKKARTHYGVWSDGCPTVNTSTEYFNETGGPDGMGAWQTFHYHSPSVRSSIYAFMLLNSKLIFQNNSWLKIDTEASRKVGLLSCWKQICMSFLQE